MRLGVIRRWRSASNFVDGHVESGTQAEEVFARGLEADRRPADGDRADTLGAEPEAVPRPGGAEHLAPDRHAGDGREDVGVVFRIGDQHVVGGGKLIVRPGSDSGDQVAGDPVAADHHRPDAGIGVGRAEVAVTGQDPGVFHAAVDGEALDAAEVIAVIGVRARGRDDDGGRGRPDDTPLNEDGADVLHGIDVSRGAAALRRDRAADGDGADAAADGNNPRGLLAETAPYVTAALDEAHSAAGVNAGREGGVGAQERTAHGDAGQTAHLDGSGSTGVTAGKVAANRYRARLFEDLDRTTCTGAIDPVRRPAD